MKKLFGIIIIGVLISAVGVYAAISARDIEFRSTNENFKADNVEDAINELYKMSKAIIYPKQIISLVKDENGYKYSLSIRNENGEEVFSKDYECTIWGVFSLTSDTYIVNDKNYRIEAQGVNSTNNFKAKIYDGDFLIYEFTGTSSGTNGSWSNNNSFNMEVVKVNNNIYYKK